jgi:hypothetical protein
MPCGQAAVWGRSLRPDSRRTQSDVDVGFLPAVWCGLWVQDINTLISEGSGMLASLGGGGGGGAAPAGGAAGTSL